MNQKLDFVFIRGNEKTERGKENCQKNIIALESLLRTQEHQYKIYNGCNSEIDLNQIALGFGTIVDSKIVGGYASMIGDLG